MKYDLKPREQAIQRVILEICDIIEWTLFEP